MRRVCSKTMNSQNKSTEDSLKVLLALFPLQKKKKSTEQANHLLYHFCSPVIFLNSETEIIWSATLTSHLLQSNYKTGWSNQTNTGIQQHLKKISMFAVISEHKWMNSSKKTDEFWRCSEDPDLESAFSVHPDISHNL